MRGSWKVPALYLATTGQASFGFISHQLPVTATTVDSSRLHFSGLIRTARGGHSDNNNNKTSRRMSSEVVAGQDFGPTDQSWRSLLEVSMAKSRKTRGSNYVQISTVNKDGEPRCRTVVFRGFLNSATLPEEHPMSPGNGGHFDCKPCVMKMCTDLRSKKVGEVAHQPISEMVRTYGSTKLQFAIVRICLFCYNDASSFSVFSVVGLVLPCSNSLQKRSGGFRKPANNTVFEDPCCWSEMATKTEAYKLHEKKCGEI